MKKYFKKFFTSGKFENHDESIKDHSKNRATHIGRKMSQGAANIFRMMKVHAKWGNKQLWGHREKGRNHKKSE